MYVNITNFIIIIKYFGGVDVKMTSYRLECGVMTASNIIIVYNTVLVQSSLSFYYYNKNFRKLILYHYNNMRGYVVIVHYNGIAFIELARRKS